MTRRGAIVATTPATAALPDAPEGARPGRRFAPDEWQQRAEFHLASLEQRELERLQSKEELEKTVNAEVALSPVAGASVIVGAFNALAAEGRSVSPATLMSQIELLAARVNAGDLRDMESLLVSQATALNALFTNLACRAATAPKACERDALLGLALKVQSACRNTVAAIGDLKTPKQVVFARQANIGHGPQQVVNHLGAEPARAHHEPDGDTIDGAQATRLRPTSRARKDSKRRDQTIRGES